MIRTGRTALQVVPFPWNRMNRKPPQPSRRVRRYLLNRLGLPRGLLSPRLLRQGFKLLDFRQLPTLRQSFGPVDKTLGKDLFAQHLDEEGLDEGELEKLAKAYFRNGLLVGGLAVFAMVGCLLCLFLGQVYLALSLAITLPVLLLLSFLNLLRGNQIRSRRYLGGLEFLRRMVSGRRQ